MAHFLRKKIGNSTDFCLGRPNLMIPLTGQKKRLSEAKKMSAEAAGRGCVAVAIVTDFR